MFYVEASRGVKRGGAEFPDSFFRFYREHLGLGVLCVVVAVPVGFVVAAAAVLVLLVFFLETLYNFLCTRD